MPVTQEVLVEGRVIVVEVNEVDQSATWEELLAKAFREEKTAKEQ